MSNTIGCAGGYPQSESYAQNLWQDIIQAHWNYLEVEENMDKLEKRDILEVQIRQLLCFVNQSRKFFVPATNHVLRETVYRTKDLSACNMMNGFDAVHQYANNLLTKPWRPEFKTIRTYSGFYKQEVERHLIDVESMFVAMGYKKMPNGVLVLKGTLCMDQVANVSRDALSAYVECQIMSEIFGKCVQYNCPVEWIDIFRIRQDVAGDVNQAVRVIIDRCCKPFNDPNPYAEIMHPMCMAGGFQYGPAVCSHQTQPIYSNGHFNNFAAEQLPLPPPPPSKTTIMNAFRAHHPSMYTLPHSKSLDQYGEHNVHQMIGHHNAVGPPYHSNSQRQSRSFDQPSTHDFNVAGQRFPIPLNESHQFQPYPYQTDSCANTSSVYDHRSYPAIATNGYHIENGGYSGMHYAVPGSIPRTISDPSRIQQETFSNHRQLSADNPPNHIDYHPIRRPTDDYRHQAAQMSSYAQTVSAKTAVTQTSNGTPTDPFIEHDFDYTENLSAPLVPQRARNHYAYEESSPNTNCSETSRGVSDFDSFDEAATTVGNYSSRSSSNRSPHLAHHPALSPHNDINGNRGNNGVSSNHGHSGKRSSQSSSFTNREQDGVGSYEAWHGVYKEINKNKTRVQDHPDVEDLSLQGLDLNQRPDGARHQSADRKMARAQDKVALIPPTTSRKSVSEDSREYRRRKESIDAALKKLPAAQAEYNQRSRSRTGTIGRKAVTSTVKEPTTSSTSTIARPRPTVSGTPNGAKDTSNRLEWSCAHCTLLNPMSVHICKVCSKSKDLITIGVSKATTTCV